MWPIMISISLLFFLAVHPYVGGEQEISSSGFHDVFVQQPLSRRREVRRTLGDAPDRV